MVRTLSLAAAFALALLGLIFPSWGLSLEGSALGRVTPGAEKVEAHSPLEQRAEVPAWLVAQSRASQSASPSEAPSRQSGQGSTLRPSLAPLAAVRPRTRSFWATGPLVARVTDPTFGPEVRPADLLIPDPPSRLAGASDLLCLAVAVYHEARDQALDGQLAVASVILNRTEEPARWGATPCEVVVPVQFSFLSEDGSYPAIPKDEAWAIAVEMAREALERGPSLLVGEADHYHTPAVDPTWNQGMDQVVQIEDHIFFVEAQPKG